MNKRITIIVVAVVISLTIITSFFYFRDKITNYAVHTSPVNYIIPGVPYFGIFDHKDSKSLVQGDTASAMASILEYWNPGKNNFVELTRFLKNYKDTSKVQYLTGDSIISYIQFAGSDLYDVKRVRLQTDELKNFINPTTKTPLFLALPISTDQPLEVPYHSAAVLIGVNEPERKVIVHNYWLGNNYEISYDDLDKLWSRMRPDEQNSYIVIQPKNLKEKLVEIDSRNIVAYSSRTEMMTEAESLLQNEMIGRGALIGGLHDLAISHLQSVVESPKFNDFLPPVCKVLVLGDLATAYLEKSDLDNAMKYANMAVDQDHDLDKPINSWIGFDTAGNSPDMLGRRYEPYMVLGDIYLKQRQYDKAKESYEMALEITPAEPGLQNKLSLAIAGTLQVKSNN